MSFVPINPRPMLQDLVNKEVIVRLKWNQQYKGRLVSTDSYMNLQLAGTEEYIDNKLTGQLGQVLIRQVLLPLFLPFPFLFCLLASREGKRESLG